MERGFTYRLVADLIQTLETEGYQIGTGQYLRVQELLRQLPDGMPAEELMYALGPLFVQTPQQQDQFYRLFQQARDRTEAYFRAIDQAQNTTEEIPLLQRRPRKLQWLLVALALLLVVPPVIVIGLYYLKESTRPYERIFTVNAGASASSCIPDSVLQEHIGSIDTFEVVYAGRKGQALGSFMLDRNCLEYIARDSVSGQDSILIRYLNGDRELLVNFRPVIEGYAVSPPTPDNKEPKKPTNPKSGPATTVARSGWSTISPPFDHDLFAYSIEAPSKLQQLLARYEDLIRLGGYILAYAFLIALLLYRFRRRQSEQIALDSDKPPYVWHIRIPEVEHLQFGPAFQRLLNRLRQRTRGGVYQLDVPGTIRATIQKAGMADFQYRQQTRQPEYLLLIDQQSARNHRARLFDYIFRTFRANEVLAERFFYDGDPRICYNKQYPDGITLTDLQQQFGYARLFIIGQGQSMLNKMTGKLAAWTTVLEGWKSRALFTPKPYDNWGRKERRLSQRFIVLPLELESLEILLEASENDEAPTAEAWQNRLAGQLRPPVQMEGPLLDTLKRHYPQPMLEWIAACALFPTLHWHLTLYLGRYLSTAEAPLLTYTNIQELCRLPWFVEGSIPDNARLQLTQWLQTEHPALLRALRTELNDVLRRYAPPAGSAAFEEHQLHTALNEYLSLGRSARRDQLSQEIATLMEAGNPLDEVAAAQLKARQPKWSAKLSDKWKERLYWQGLPALGLKHLWREMRWFIPALFFVAGLSQMPWNLSLSPCEGALVALKSKEASDFVCLNERTAWQLFLETRARQQIQTTQDPISAISAVSRSLSCSRGLSVLEVAREDQTSTAHSWEWYFPEPGASLNSSWGRVSTFRDSLMITLDAAPGIDTLDQELRANLAVLLYNKGAEIARQMPDSLSGDGSACTYFAAALAIDSVHLPREIMQQWCEGQAGFSPECRILGKNIAFRSRPVSDAKLEEIMRRFQNNQGDTELNTDWALFQVPAGTRATLLEERALGYWAVIRGIPGYLPKFPEEDSLLIPCETRYRYVQGQVLDGTKQSAAPLSGVMVLTDQYTAITDGEGNFTLEIPNRLAKPGQLVFYQKVGYQPDTITSDLSLERIPSVQLYPDADYLDTSAVYSVSFVLQNLSDGSPLSDVAVRLIQPDTLVGLTGPNGRLDLYVPRPALARNERVAFQFQKEGFQSNQTTLSFQELEKEAVFQKIVVLKPEGNIPVQQDIPQQTVEASTGSRYLWCLNRISQDYYSPTFDDGRTRLDGQEIITDLLNRIKAGLEQNNISYFEVNPIGKRPTEGEQVQRINAQPGNKLVLTFSFGFTGSVSNPASATQDFDFTGAGSGLGFVLNPAWATQDKGGISARINSSESSARLAAIFMEAIMRQTSLRNANLATAPESPSPLLNGLQVPVAIFQNGFLTNRENATLLVQPAFRQELANAYLSAIYAIESSGLAKTPAPYIENRDADDDGIENRLDRCPFEPGEGTSDGCPVEKTDQEALEAALRKATGVWEERKNTPQNFNTTGTIFPEIGVRGRYGILKTLINPAALETLIGEPVYLSGPHNGADINFNAEDAFGYYNPAFLTKLTDYLNMAAQNQALQRQLQPLYNQEFRQVMRTFYQMHQFGTSQQQLQRPFLELLRSVTKERKSIAVNRFFLDNFRNLPGDGDSLEKMMAARFWFRRSIDGTDEEFYNLMLLTLQTFDPDFLYRQTN
ncbi:MAG: N-acetylmuramoyl-L-alanine amidase [Phaeodactylibacter xiamenensis]|uniref:MurNAc-LAA domain-containing protein n=1 Tax=Phaeodactylibacter xiamenensis TaxID=1524460 RepID=A0A098S7Y3_9BACT|nr:N-acetylmuramoyl-L-alanine amidase [Phaeodactylibacter xiamenensis]KGE87758.1 hypothetical protein IX84_13365 [Phaeodactylibacter xiamenensis]MCR9052181.1 N-acetylmuramoyl-L-alanine amidase [bacterium]